MLAPHARDSLTKAKGTGALTFSADWLQSERPLLTLGWWSENEGGSSPTQLLPRHLL